MTNRIEIDWDNLANYLNERDGKNLTVEQWKEYFSNKASVFLYILKDFEK